MISRNGDIDRDYAENGGYQGDYSNHDSHGNIHEEEAGTRAKRDPYVTVSKGQTHYTTSLCSYCCWNVLEVIKAFILPTFYTVTVALCVIYCWQIIENFIKSRDNPIETLSYKFTNQYESPGVAVFMYNSSFVHCEMVYAYDDDIDPYPNPDPKPGPEPPLQSHRMRSERRGGLGSILHSAVKPDSKPCEFTAISDYHSKTARRNSSIMVFKGPGNVRRREYMKIHFMLDNEDIGLKFGFMEFFPFYNFTNWVSNGSSMEYLQQHERLQDIWPLALGFMTYCRLAIRVFETDTRIGKEHHVLFTPVNDIVKYVGENPANYTPRYENMYAIFEWKEAEYEIVKQVVTQSLWTTVGLFVTAILTILRILDLTKVIIKRQKSRSEQERISCFSMFKSCCNCCKNNEDVNYERVNS